jgi:alkylated DNA repair dioxygenase AlkB
MFGKRTYENRYSQFFVTDASVGNSYHYSGTSRKCVTCDPSLEDQQLVLDLCRVADQLVTQLMDENLVKRPSGPSSQSFYNSCLANWYRSEHSIGLHSDDEKEMNLEVPILSLSWGGTRRFLLRPKPKAANEAINKVHEVLLKDGDLLIMGGKCQEEFKHEVPKVRKKDGLVGDRISWTIRSMKQGIKRKR